MNFLLSVTCLVIGFVVGCIWMVVQDFLFPEDEYPTE
jgi:hypothetical protein